MIGEYVEYQYGQEVRKGIVKDKSKLAFIASKEFKSTENGDTEVLKKSNDFTQNYIGIDYYLIQDLETGETNTFNVTVIKKIIDPIITDIDDYCKETSKLVRLVAEMASKSRSKTLNWGKLQQDFNRKNNPVKVQIFQNGNVQFVKSEQLIKEEK